MNRLDEMFARARGAGRKVLCPFLTGGYPLVGVMPGLMRAVEGALGGLGVIEIGVPFSDPVADGPVIQASYTKALAKGCTVDGVLGGIAAARAGGVGLPVVVMVSYSIIFRRGVAAFAEACVKSGVDGIVFPDVPLEESGGVVEITKRSGLRTVLLIAPTTPEGRRGEIAKLCDGFVYYLSVSGITGERRSLPTDVGPNVAGLRKVARCPICVGFGISTAEQVREVTRVADGAIVGSALIRRLAEHENGSEREQCEAVGGMVGELARGLVGEIVKSVKVKSIKGALEGG